MYYKITYKSYNDMSQIKRLISIEEYTLYKKLSSEKHEIESLIKENKKDQKLITVLKENLKPIKEELQQFSFPFFVVGSPLYDAISTGILSLPKSQGGDHPTEIIPIQNFKETIEE